MPVAINQPKPIASPLDAIANALGVVEKIQGIKVHSAALDKAQREADLYARTDDPNSSESQIARADAQGFLGMVSKSELGKKNKDALSPLLKISQDPSVSANTLKNAFENSPIMKNLTSLANQGEKSSLAGAIWGNRQEMQQDRMDNQNHQKVLSKLKSDPSLVKRIGNFQNLENAGANITQADSLTPQQIEEYQQVVRGSLGIGAGGVNERSSTYIHTLGLNAANIQQLITGDPAQISKDSNLMKHFQNLASIEQGNIKKQTDKRINALASGNASMYARRPDLKADLMDAVNSIKDQVSNETPGGPPQSAPHGQAVIQNGHTFNWNPKKGNYE
jgi:hypothetical protein